MITNVTLWVISIMDKTKKEKGLVMEYFCSKEVFGSIKIINRIVAEILSDIGPLINDDDTYFDVRLILNELLINCHEHGNQRDCNKKIKLELAIHDNTISIKVQDEGKGVKKRSIYQPQDCKSNGRGLLIVESLTDKIRYDHNKVECIIFI